LFLFSSFAFVAVLEAQADTAKASVRRNKTPIDILFFFNILLNLIDL